ncbi:APSES transcription factor [Blastomyces dermatitidis ER-3]|uniref:Cell pattern formation-associated protein stuA n=3 Tax=Blastomyces TaxID=229219 RepID=A0A179UQB2_BLAGS|nr:APSES transcription factor [Blastomyces gilchristii SLH14081]XP_045274722.1 APSES transcription factor [Blastomyces dermatitidis ER-3]EEQ87390.2 APSES transcription factor [Blastomyces dermatitidis ER-3]EGE78027.1 APSES transcription factor [Blastomyces dermatitidis ATCC 18188]OAT10060.1 APSES transcription factor [Blastomyces gilchristii SLH14081]
MSFSRNTLGPSDGASSQNQMPSINAASQSVASTPAATPPPRHSQQSNMSMSFPSNAVSRNSLQRASFGGYDDNNGYGQVMLYEEYKPQIYTAVYSNVSVYEMEVNGVAVMRRRSDSWLNATQILKVAGVMKARRTKTLEKEVAAGEHEKVQGGYGKYQGTWVNYERGVELCRHYHVFELLRPLLEYDMGQDGTGPAGRGAVETPTKEQAMAAQRKRLYRTMDGQGMSQTQQGTYFQNISRTAVSAVNAINKARFDSTMRKGSGGRRSSMKVPSQMGSQESQIQPASQQSLHSIASDSGFGSNMQNSQQTALLEHTDEAVEPPRKRMRSSSAQEKSFQSTSAIPPHTSMIEPTPTEPNDSFYQMHPGDAGPDGPMRGLHHLPAATTPDRYQKMKLVMTLFLDKRAKDFSNHPAFLNLSAEDLEIPLDKYYNSALHWAAMLARMPLVHALTAKGVSIYRLNGAGETALQKAVGTRNNLDYRSFSKLLHVLYPTIEIVDYHGRTVLHHIAMMAATGGGGHVAAKHYLESLLEFIVRYGGPAGSVQASLNTTANGSNGQHQVEVIGLGKFMSEMVNIQDDQGDTVLNLAGRARTVLVPQLLEVGANPHIPNNTGLRPADYGVGVDMVNGGLQNGESESFSTRLSKTRRELLDLTISQVTSLVEQSFGSIDNELSSGLGRKQEEFEQWHRKIRESAKARQIEQKQLDDMKRRARDRIELDRQIKNLERASEELAALLKSLQGDQFKAEVINIGDADDALGVDMSQFSTLFPEDFDISTAGGFSDQQVTFLESLPGIEILTSQLGCYRDHNDEVCKELESLKSKNVVLGENYRRMVMACTGWTEEQVDEAADGLTECIKDLNEHPLPEDVAIEILMKDRGQDW